MGLTYSSIANNHAFDRPHSHRNVFWLALKKKSFCTKDYIVENIISTIFEFFQMKYIRLPISESKVSIAYSGLRLFFQKDRAGISFFVKKTDEGKPNLLKD